MQSPPSVSGVPSTTTRRDPLARGAAALAGSVTMVLALLALFGWAWGVRWLGSLAANRMPMAGSTAVLLLLDGAAIAWYALAPGNRRARQTGVVAGWLSILVATVALTLNGLGIEWTGEHLGVNVSGMVDGAAIGHMSPISAVCFLLVSASLLASLTASAPGMRRVALAVGSAAGVVVTSFAFLLGYVFGAPLASGGTFIPPALSTLLGFLMLGLALLSLVGPPDKSSNASVRAAFPFILILLLLAAGITTSGYIYYRHYEKIHRAEVERQLSAIADLKVSELTRWREDRLSDAAIFFRNPTFTAVVRRFFDQPADTAAQRQLLDWLGKYPTLDDCDQVRLIDTRGVTRLSAPDHLDPASSHTLRAASEALRSRQIGLRDFYRDEHSQRAYLSVQVPVLDESNVSGPLGVLVLRLDPAKYLYPFIQRLPTSSPTAETPLVRRDGNDVLFLNDLRHQPRVNETLPLRIPLTRTEVPAVRAVLGETGVLEGPDYRGVPVISIARAVPDSPWFLIAKIDRTEVYAPTRERRWQMTGVVAILLFGASAGVGVAWRQQRVRFYRKEAESMTALQLERQNLASIFNSSPVAMFILDDATRIVRANEAAVALAAGPASGALEHRPGNALGCVHSSGDPRGCGYAPACPLCPLRNGLEGVLRGRGPMRGVDLMLTLVRGGAPQQVWVTIGAEPLELDGHRHLCVAMQDITTRKEAERQLGRQLDELRQWFQVTLGREDRVRQLKGEVNDLRQLLGDTPRYSSQIGDPGAMPGQTSTPDDRQQEPS